MAERETSNEGKGKLTAQERAEQLFEKRITAPDYNGDEIQKALDRVRSSGLRNRLGSSPAEVFSKLTEMSAKAKQRAAEAGATEDAQRFAEKQSEFAAVSEMLTGVPVESQTPSAIKRVTGLASG